MLHAEVTGKGGPVVLVHGFTQSGGAWARVAEGLSRRHTVITVDAPGHGGSSGVAADLARGADLMVESAGQPAAWVGYSMGGRYALHAALRHPRAVTRLVLVSATAGIDDPVERAARRRDDAALAARVESEGVEDFLRWWLDRPIFSTLPPDAAALDSRIGNTAVGLAASLRLAGTGTQEPLWTAIGALEMPVLVVAGERDPTYLAHAHRMVGCIGGNATLAIVAGAGHSCHLEQPEAFLGAVEPFLG
ncbi:MAG: alpha/beta fold hydrolase [Acidimicrobiales bacterium]